MKHKNVILHMVLLEGMEWKDATENQRELRSALSKAGFVERPAKGSHTFWFHSIYQDLKVTVSGKDGDDAQKYQIKDVWAVLRRLGGKE